MHEVVSLDDSDSEPDSDEQDVIHERTRAKAADRLIEASPCVLWGRMISSERRSPGDFCV
jgi:hypothetical protein